MPKKIYSIETLEKMESCPWLSDRERAVFHKRFRRGMSIADIAASTDIKGNDTYTDGIGQRTVSHDLQMIREKSRVRINCV